LAPLLNLHGLRPLFPLLLTRIGNSRTRIPLPWDDKEKTHPNLQIELTCSSFLFPNTQKRDLLYCNCTHADIECDGSYVSDAVSLVSRKLRAFSVPTDGQTPTSATFTVADREWEVVAVKDDAWWERQRGREKGGFEKEKAFVPISLSPAPPGSATTTVALFRAVHLRHWNPRRICHRDSYHLRRFRRRHRLSPRLRLLSFQHE